jgi:hypothetical protein
VSTVDSTAGNTGLGGRGSCGRPSVIVRLSMIVDCGRSRAVSLLARTRVGQHSRSFCVDTTFWISEAVTRRSPRR